MKARSIILAAAGALAVLMATPGAEAGGYRHHQGYGYGAGYGHGHGHWRPHHGYSHRPPGYWHRPPPVRYAPPPYYRRPPHPGVFLGFRL